MSKNDLSVFSGSVMIKNICIRTGLVWGFGDADTDIREQDNCDTR